MKLGSQIDQDDWDVGLYSDSNKNLKYLLQFYGYDHFFRLNYYFNAEIFWRIAENCLKDIQRTYKGFAVVS